MYGSHDWAISGAGGDLCLPGAVEYQHLHRDSHPLGEAPAPPSQALPLRRLVLAEKAKNIGIKGRSAEELSLVKMRQISEMLPPSGTINFLMTDTTALNGPIRQIPGAFSQTYGSILTVILHINDVPCCWNQEVMRTCKCRRCRSTSRSGCGCRRWSVHRLAAVSLESECPPGLIL